VIIETASTYRPPWWLRSPHVQSMLGSSPMRIRHGARLLAALGTHAETVVLDAGEGVRLQGVYNAPRAGAPRGLALLLHGWEGSTESSYMRLTAAKLLQAGFATFRLNFRDHGDSHHLNPGLFHSNRIDAVVRAAVEVSRRYPLRPLVAAAIRWAATSPCAWRCARPPPACRWRAWPRSARWSIRRRRWTRWNARCRSTCATSSTSGGARCGASASCSPSSTISTTRRCACACAT
jgi:hypothetical protein